MDDAISRSTVYISLLDALDTIYNIDTSGCADADDVIGRIYEAVGEIPDADVAPMVHASWVRDDCMNARCSNCHTRLPFRHCYDEEDGYEWDDEIDETPWCMHCGARMDGEADES